MPACLSCLSCLWLAACSADGPEIPGLRLLVGDLHRFYQTHTDFQTNDDFGIYAIAVDGDDLYLAFSSGQPTRVIGGLVARRRNRELVPLLDADGRNPISEQGLHELVWHDGRLYVLGTDPCCPDHWNLGNLYTYAPAEGRLVKHRTLPQTLHTLGLWFDPANGDLVVSTGAHEQDRYVGRLIRSSDGGETWHGGIDLAAHRVYDVAGVPGNLCAVTHDDPEQRGSASLQRSEDGGRTWQTVEGVTPRPLPRLLVTPEGVAGVSQSLDRVFLVGAHGRLSFRALGDWKIRPVPNPLASDGSHVFAIADGGRVLVASPNGPFQELAQLDAELASVAWWPAKQALVLASTGPDAKLWKLGILTTDATP